jgi:hypothetical protein
MRQLLSATPRSLYPRERDPIPIGGWVGPRADLDRWGKFRFHRDFFCSLFVLYPYLFALDPRTLQYVVSRYTDSAIPTHCLRGRCEYFGAAIFRAAQYVQAKGFWRWFVFRIIEFMDFFHRQIKTKAKRLKLLRFESGFCFRLQVNNKKIKIGGGWGVINVIGCVPLIELISNLVILIF